MNLTVSHKSDSTAWLDEGDKSIIPDEFKHLRKLRSNSEIEDITKNEAVAEEDSEEGSDEL